MTLASIKAAIGRYSGYTRFVEPVWSFYVGQVAARPKTAAVVILVLALFAIR